MNRKRFPWGAWCFGVATGASAGFLVLMLWRLVDIMLAAR